VIDLTKAILLLFVGALLTFLATAFWVRRAAKAAHDKRVTELERQMAVLMAEAKPINAYVQAMAIAKLTHFHTPETDKLLAKVGARERLSGSDVERLAHALKERESVVDSEVDEEERIWARILPDIIRLAKIEADRLASGTVPVDVLRVIVPSPGSK
jgi:hypothetical protein